MRKIGNVFSNLAAETRPLFEEVERLHHLFLVVPTSVASSERSFSTLHRLKMWLRSTVSQKRLNHCALLHSHQEEADSLNIVDLCERFIFLNDSRGCLFGKC